MPLSVTINVGDGAGDLWWEIPGGDGVCASNEHFLMFLPCEDGSHPGPRAFIHE